MGHKYTNRLINELSPYLLQHAHNPVEWYPWCEDAFEKASHEDKPVLLSIGYSACHWCHVMERESFENEDIAGIMNRLFINIKVDREERPDIDDLYQHAVQLFGGNGGWPLTVFLTPEREPFFGGTYYPPEARYGSKGLPDILRAVSEAYHGRKREIEATMKELKNVLARITDKVPTGEEINIADIDNASSSILRNCDLSHGGFGTAPKFPNTTQLSLLLRYYKKSSDPMAIEAVENTLRNMAEGGIHDQLGGGFHRYAVDERWQIPHFEKMLNDNALIIRVYLDAYRITKDQFFKNIAEKTLNYLFREMYHPVGGFYTSQDADSEGVEGKYFVWTKKEIESLLGRDAEIICRYYGVTDDGNYEGKNVLHIDREIKALAHEFELSENDIERIIANGREKLIAKRMEREKPFRDTKIITGWNGLAVSALIDAYQICDKDTYLDKAKETLDFTRSNLFKDDKLLHAWKDDAGKINGDLSDYAFIIASAIDMFEITFEDEYLSWAESLTNSLIQLMWDNERGGFYNSAVDENERLFHRMKTGSDQAVPSGNASTLTNLIKLSFYRDNEDYRSIAEKTLRIFYNKAIENPFNYAGLILASYLYIEGPKEITIAGKKADDEVQRLLRKIRGTYIPEKVLYVVDETKEGRNPPGFTSAKGQKENRITAYICQNLTCSKPLTELEEIEKLI